MRCSNSDEFRRVCGEVIGSVNKVVVLFDNTLSITKTLREISKSVNIEVVDITGKIEWKKTPEKVKILNNIINTYWQGRDLNDINERINFIKDEEYNEDDLDDVIDTVESFNLDDGIFIKKWVNNLVSKDKKLRMPVKEYKIPGSIKNIRFIRSKDDIVLDSSTLIIINETHEHYPEDFFSDLMNWVYKDMYKIMILEKDKNKINLFNLFRLTANDINKICYASIKNINLNLLCINLK